MTMNLCAIHGILTGNTPQTWPQQFQAWLAARDAGVQVVPEKYFEGPFPRFNWFKNRWVAAGLARKLAALQSAAPAPVPLWFVAHSNGACIALLAARWLIRRGHKVAGLLLTGAACEADVARNGVLAWQEEQALGTAIAYCSKDDTVLDGDAAVVPWSVRPGRLWAKLREWAWGRAIWPYGCLGRTGWQENGQDLDVAVSPSIFTRWFAGGHSAYFLPGAIEHTFEQIYADISR